LLFEKDIPVDQCEKLIQEKHIDLNTVVGSSNLLEKAILYGNSKVMEFLLKRRAHVNKRNGDNDSRLHETMWDHETIDSRIRKVSEEETATKAAMRPF
jgi:hypothetical protein